MTSHLVPLLTYPNSYNNILKKHRIELEKIGDYIKTKNMRVDMHPDQYLVLNSTNPSIIESTISSLDYYDDLMNAMNLKIEERTPSMNRFEEELISQKTVVR